MGGSRKSFLQRGRRAETSVAKSKCATFSRADRQTSSALRVGIHYTFSRNDAINIFEKLLLAMLLKANSQRKLFHHQVSEPFSEVDIIDPRRD